VKTKYLGGHWAGNSVEREVSNGAISSEFDRGVGNRRKAIEGGGEKVIHPLGGRYMNKAISALEGGYAHC